MDAEERETLLAETMRETREGARQVGESAARLTALGGGVTLVLQHALDDDESETRSLVVVLTGRIPPECCAQIEDLVERWSQDLHVGSIVRRTVE